jgi:fatty acid synthase subunit beta
MTYAETVHRMVRLLYVAHQRRWVDTSLRDLLGDWLRRIEERCAPHAIWDPLGSQR